MWSASAEESEAAEEEPTDGDAVRVEDDGGGAWSGGESARSREPVGEASAVTMAASETCGDESLETPPPRSPSSSPFPPSSLLTPPSPAQWRNQRRVKSVWGCSSPAGVAGTGTVGGMACFPGRILGFSYGTVI